jgi:hypothetical protein
VIDEDKEIQASSYLTEETPPDTPFGSAMTSPGRSNPITPRTEARLKAAANDAAIQSNMVFPQMYQPTSFASEQDVPPNTPLEKSWVNSPVSQTSMSSSNFNRNNQYSIGESQNGVPPNTPEVSSHLSDVNSMRVSAGKAGYNRSAHVVSALPARTRMISDDVELQQDPPITPMENRSMKSDLRASHSSAFSSEASNMDIQGYLDKRKVKGNLINLHYQPSFSSQGMEFGSYAANNSVDNPPNTPADSNAFMNMQQQFPVFYHEASGTNRPRSNANLKLGGPEYNLTPRTENYLKQSIKASMENAQHARFAKHHSDLDDQDVPPNTPASSLGFSMNNQFSAKASNDNFIHPSRFHARSPDSFSRDSSMGSP